MEVILQQLVNGLFLGSIYALLALGYTMVYGIIGLINFAHGEVYMIGSFIGFYLINQLHLNFFIAMIISMIGAAILGVVVEFFSLSSFEKINEDRCIDYSDRCLVFSSKYHDLFLRFE